MHTNMTISCIVVCMSHDLGNHALVHWGKQLLLHTIPKPLTSSPMEASEEDTMFEKIKWCASFEKIGDNDTYSLVGRIKVGIICQFRCVRQNICQHILRLCPYVWRKFSCVYCMIFNLFNLEGFTLLFTRAYRSPLSKKLPSCIFAFLPTFIRFGLSARYIELPLKLEAILGMIF